MLLLQIPSEGAAGGRPRRWWVRAVVVAAWLLVAAVGAAMVMSWLAFEGGKPPDRCGRLSEEVRAAGSHFLAVPRTFEWSAPDVPSHYQLIYHMPDTMELYLNETLSTKSGEEGIPSFYDWSWMRLIAAARDPLTPKTIVLFVHGNAGSGRQVQDLSLVIRSLRPDLASPGHTGPQLAVFAMHYLDELSALEGHILRRQAQSLVDCLKFLLDNLYAAQQVTPKVILVGHSMGGVVARAALAMSNAPTQAVTSLIVLGAPLQMSIWPFDPSLAAFYHDINTEPTFEKVRIPVLSIAGGVRDHLIRTELSMIDGIVPPEEGLFVVTTAIPGIRATLDHNELVECGRLLMVLARCIVDISYPPDNCTSITGDDMQGTMAMYRSYFTSRVPTLLGLRDGADEAFGLVHRTNSSSLEMETETIEISQMAPWHVVTNGSRSHTYTISWSSSARVEQEQFLLVTNISPSSLRVTLNSVNRSSSQVATVPLSWWIQAPDYVPADLAGIAREHQIPRSPQILVLPARYLLDWESIGVEISPLIVNDIEWQDQSYTDENFIFVQLFDPNETLYPMFRSPWGTLALASKKDTQTTRSDTRRAALAHISLPGRSQPVSLRVRPSSQMTRPLWTPIIYHYSACSAQQAEEESVFIVNDEVFIRSNYLTIPHLIKQCTNHQGAVSHLFVFSDPSLDYEVTIEQDFWSMLAHIFWMHATLVLPAALLIYTIVLVVQFSTGSPGLLPSFSVAFSQTAPIIMVVAVCSSIILCALDPSWLHLLHESSVVFDDLPFFAPSLSFSRDDEFYSSLPYYLPFVVLSSGTMLVLCFTMLQVCLNMLSHMIWQGAKRITSAHGGFLHLLKSVSVWRERRWVKASCYTLAIPGVVYGSIGQPFFFSMFLAVLLTVSYAKDESLRHFRGSWSILLALLSVYHFGCIWLSSVMIIHPLDEATFVTIPVLLVAIVCMFFDRLPCHPHCALYALIRIGTACISAYIGLYSWHAVHRIAYAAAALGGYILLIWILSLICHLWSIRYNLDSRSRSEGENGSNLAEDSASSSGWFASNIRWRAAWPTPMVGFRQCWRTADEHIPLGIWTDGNAPSSPQLHPL